MHLRAALPPAGVSVARFAVHENAMAASITLLVLRARRADRFPLGACRPGQRLPYPRRWHTGVGLRGTTGRLDDYGVRTP
jgi:hypothetical protein